MKWIIGILVLIGIFGIAYAIYSAELWEDIDDIFGDKEDEED